MVRKKLKATGLLATCIQHEMDHLDGVLFIDYLSKLKRDMIIKKLVKHKGIKQSNSLNFMAFKLILWVHLILLFNSKNFA